MSAGWSSQRKVVGRDWVQPADMQESVLQRGVMEYPAWLRNLAVCRLAQSHRLQETDVCTCLSWTKPAYKTDLSPSWWRIWCPPVAKPEIFNFTYMFVPTFRVRGHPEQSCGRGFWRRSSTVAVALDLRMKGPSEEKESLEVSTNRSNATVTFVLFPPDALTLPAKAASTWCRPPATGSR